MKNSIVFYLFFFICFVVINLGVYQILYAPYLDEYQKQQEKIEANKQQQNKIIDMYQKINEYKKVESIYKKSDKLFHKLIDDKFKSSKIKIFFNKLGKKLNTYDIMPAEVKDHDTLDDGEKKQEVEFIGKADYKYANYSIETVFSFEQLIDFTTYLIRNPKIFYINQMEIKGISERDRESFGSSEKQEKKKIKKPFGVRMKIAYLYFRTPSKSGDEEL